MMEPKIKRTWDQDLNDENIYSKIKMPKLLKQKF